MDTYDAEYVRQLEKEIKLLKEQNASQLSMYEMTTLYLKKLQDELRMSEKRLSLANKNMTASITYAKHIQDALIVQQEDLQHVVPQSFMLNMAKDIVSGDFVWTHSNAQGTWIALGDCTGHGVPGAMLSVFVISLLNQIVAHAQEYTPSKVIRELDLLMQKYLSMYSHRVKDSAEIALILIRPDGKSLLYSGAKRPLVFVRNSELMLYKGSNFILGNSEKRKEEVQDLEVHVRKGDMLYMLSDGFGDQFGGEQDSKLGSKKVLSLFQEIAQFSIDLQREKLENFFLNWKGKNKQTDDVLVLGIALY